MNHAAETLLHDAGLLTSSAPFYRGRPVLVTENDYIHKLFNGDTGIILPDPETGHLRAFFAAPDGTIQQYTVEVVRLLFVNVPTSARSSMRLSSFLWSLYSLIVFRSTSTLESVALPCALNGVGRSKLTTNGPEMRKPPAEPIAASSSRSLHVVRIRFARRFGRGVDDREQADDDHCDHNFCRRH